MAPKAAIHGIAYAVSTVSCLVIVACIVAGVLLQRELDSMSAELRHDMLEFKACLLTDKSSETMLPSILTDHVGQLSRIVRRRHETEAQRRSDSQV